MLIHPAEVGKLGANVLRYFVTGRQFYYEINPRSARECFKDAIMDNEYTVAGTELFENIFIAAKLTHGNWRIIDNYKISAVVSLYAGTDTYSYTACSRNNKCHTNKKHYTEHNRNNSFHSITPFYLYRRYFFQNVPKKFIESETFLCYHLSNSQNIKKGGGKMSRKTSFERFVMDNMDSCYRFAYSYAKNREDAEDILNESMLKGWKSVGDLREERFMKTWFYKIISNTAITYLRKKGTYIALEDDALERLGTYEDEYDYSSFDDMIRILPEKYKEVIVLRYFEDMSIAEVATVLDLNENTVKTRIHRALKILKIDMEKE